jgi:Reverse transcriptase (RNA-dependent DNA polymerase)
VTSALQTCTNKSAPGLSGIPYELVWWVNDACPDLLPTLFNAALRLGIHPWTEAKVVVIPKPGKTDYSVPKSYCPISLLKCIGKVLEKIIARHLGSDINHFNLLRPSQFGSQPHHLATDTATILRHKAESTIRAKQIGVVVLLDISQFFDSLDPSTMFKILIHLSVDQETCLWVQSLMADRSVRLQVNNFMSETFRPDSGTPQGSPTSPIISALFTSPLLQEAMGWEEANLSLYIDNGAIFTSGPTFNSTTAKAAKAGSAVFLWLRCFGLSADAKKTEVMFFTPPCTPVSLFGTWPSHITFMNRPDPIWVKFTNSLCYLRVFFMP